MTKVLILDGNALGVFDSKELEVLFKVWASYIRSLLFPMGSSEVFGLEDAMEVACDNNALKRKEVLVKAIIHIEELVWMCISKTELIGLEVLVMDKLVYLLVEEIP